MTTLTPLLRAAPNLATFHRQHEEFYAQAPRQQAVDLQRHARTLQALADTWTGAHPSTRQPFSPFEGSEDLNSPVAIQLEGVLFLEGGGEPAEITKLKRDLRSQAADAAGSGDWLRSAMEGTWEVAAELIAVPELADLLGERHRIIANDWQAAHLSTLAGRLIDRAADILDAVDFTPTALRADLDGGGTAAARVYSAAELLDRAADLASDSAGLVHDNERRWRIFRARVEQLLAAGEPRDD